MMLTDTEERLIRIEDKVDTIVGICSKCNGGVRLTAIETSLAWHRRIGGFFIAFLSSGIVIVIKKAFL